jgi:superfamily II DNA or RNA helicase
MDQLQVLCQPPRACSVDLALLKLPAARSFQRQAIQMLRDGRAAGNRCQMVMAPTGAGKTILAMLIIVEALKRGKHVIFVAIAAP